MTGLHLTPEAVQARRLELATVEEQIRALGRRKSVLRAEILSGYAAPAKGAPVEQLPLVETTPATQPPEAPARAPEAAKPAAAARTALQLRTAVLELLRAAKGRRSAKVLATLLGESEEDVAYELEGLELAREVIGKNTSDKAGRAYELRDRWEAKRGKDRDTKPGKPLDATLFKPSKHPEHLLPTLTSKGKRAVLDLLKSAPGGRMPLREITARLGLPDALPFPSECYYQSGDWVLKETPKASKKLAPSKPAPKVKPAAKKAARAPKRARGPVSPARSLADDIEAELREWGTWYDAGQLEAKIREKMPLTSGPSSRDWNGVLADMLRSQRIERREEGGRVQFRLAPLPAKKPAPEAPRPTVTVGEAVTAARTLPLIPGVDPAPAPSEEPCPS